MFRTFGLLSGILCLVAGVTVWVISYRNSITPEGIIVHHAALPEKLEGHEVDAETIDHIHKQRGFGAFYWGRVYHVGYHFIILPDGTVQQGRPEHLRGAHAAGYDSFLGICLIGNFSQNSNPNGDRGLKEPTEAQLQALSELVKRLRANYDIPLDRIRRHDDVNPRTECPGDRFSLKRLMERF